MNDTQPQPKYHMVLILTAIYCKNCEKGQQLAAPLMFGSPDELTTAAELLHKNFVEHEKILCINQKLIITFENQFASRAWLVEEQSKQLASASRKIF